MRINQIITEAVSSVLYHAAPFRGALAILKGNTIGKTENDTGEISFARSLTGTYHRENRQMGVIFEVDGNKINQRYKGQPIGTEDWDEIEDDEDENFGKTGHGYRGKDNGQLEDRVKGPITQFNSYVKNAIIFTPIEYLDTSYESELGDHYGEDIQHIVTVIKYLNKYNIPYRFVSTEKELYKKSVNNKEGFLNVLRNLASDAEQATARQVLSFVERKFGAMPLYARVDLIPQNNGEPQLMELELVEPSFFLWASAGSADRAAQAIIAANR